MRNLLEKLPLRTSFCYAVLAAAYITISDQLLLALFNDADLISRMQTYKGWAFVIITALLLYLTLTHQVGAQIKAEEELRKLNEELEDRITARTRELEKINQHLETFAHTVSHDLKAPLRGIDGYSCLLLEGHLANLDEEGALFLRAIRRSTDQMNRLIDDLLAYSRLEQRPWQENWVDLKSTLEQITANFFDQLHDSSIVLTSDLPDVQLKVDPEGLAIIIRNLLDNAVKFTDPLRSVLIALKGTVADSELIISISDNGIGFDMQYHDRIFGIFNRLHRAEDYPGTGIGLTIAQKAAERMNGRIEAESTPGAGSIFRLILPLSSSECSPD